jgi:DNA-binding CsgD family transcriptional regulator
VYFRLIRPGDFPACISLIHPGFKASTRVRPAMPSLWRRLLAGEQLHGCAMVDPHPSEAGVVVGFGMSVFVDETFVEEYLRAPRPYLNAIIYEGMLRGRSPVLERAALRDANTRACLNLFVLHFGMRETTPPTMRELDIVEKGRLGFRLMHEGYRVKRVLQEVYGPLGVAYMRAGGFQVATDFSTYYAARGGTAPPAPEEHPYLMVIARDDPESQLPGSAVSYLFRHAQPRFALTPAEQRVLLRTLADESDETVAGELGVSRDAVKKVWRRIYQRVSAVDPELLDGDNRSNRIDPIVRTRERRLRLLRYLRYHLEELRPFDYNARLANAPKRRRERQARFEE